MATTYSMDEEKKKDDELVFGQRDFDAPRREVTMKDFESEKPKTRESRFINPLILMIALIKPILFKFMNSKAVKELVVKLLEAYSKTTDNTIDDKLTALVKKNLLPE